MVWDGSGRTWEWVTQEGAPHEKTREGEKPPEQQQQQQQLQRPETHVITTVRTWFIWACRDWLGNKRLLKTYMFFTSCRCRCTTALSLSADQCGASSLLSLQEQHVFFFWQRVSSIILLVTIDGETDRPTTFPFGIFLECSAIFWFEQDGPCAVLVIVRRVALSSCEYCTVVQ